MVGFHSETLGTKDLKTCDTILDELSDIKDTTIILSMPNADLVKHYMGEIFKFCKNKSNIHAFENLGALLYLSCLKHSKVLVGNSSSGILEAPFLGCYTINIGMRQEGRIKATTVFDINLKPGLLKDLIVNLCEDIEKNGRPRSQTIFGKGNASKKMIEIISKQIPALKKPRHFMIFNLPIKNYCHKKLE